MAGTRPLQALISAWREQYDSTERCRIDLCAPYTSCASLSIAVHWQSVKLDLCVNQFAELLRIVELMTRPGVDPRALHLLSLDRDDCPMEQRGCAFCDDADRVVALKLEPLWLAGASGDVSFAKVVRRAIYKWDDAAATPAFHALRRWLLARAGGAERTQPVELRIVLIATKDPMAHKGMDRLLRRARKHVATSSALFRITSLQARATDRTVMRLMAESQLPVSFTHAKGWEALRDVASGGGPLLRLTKLHTYVPVDDGDVQSLFQFVRAQAAHFKTLTVRENTGGHVRRNRVALVFHMCQSLFAPESALRLDRLELHTPLDEVDLKLMIAMLESTAASRPPKNAGRL
ncbi:hypothetical protein ATCC90586_010720 [Pythium insidiosum]|nr:hypothetical protein ATCC90586_010720 [Pythium insidiosum]